MSGLWAPQDCSARSVFSEILCTFEGHHTNEAEPLEHHSAIGHFPKMGELIKDILSSGVKTEGLRKQWLIILSEGTSYQKITASMQVLQESSLF